VRVRQLVKCFTWHEPDRPDVVLGAGLRIDPKTHVAKLKADSRGRFPTSADLLTRSRLTEPQALRRWTGFDATVRHAKDGPTQLTGAMFRLNDGTDDRWWDGGAWSVAGAGDWNTEAEVAGNIAAWDVAALGKKLRAVVNLSTTDRTVTPELVEVLVLFEAVMGGFQEDIIYRSLLPALKAGIRPIMRKLLSMPATGTTFTIAQLQLETGYNVVGIDSVHDYDAMSAADKELALKGFVGAAPDLLLSFADPTVTLTGSVTQGTNLLVRFITEPEVSWNTSQDYVEAAKVPAVVLDSVELQNAAEFPGSGVAVRDKAAGTAVLVPQPLVGDLAFKLIAMANKGVDEQRLSEDVRAFFADNPFITSTAIDERYRLRLINEFESVGEPGQNEIHMGQADARLDKFCQWQKTPTTENLVKPPVFDGEEQSGIIGVGAGGMAFRKTGSVIEGRGPWTAAWAADLAAGRFWQAAPRYGGPTFELGRRYDFGSSGPGAGMASPNQLTPLGVRAIGSARVDRAVRFGGLGRYQIGPDTPDGSTPLPAFPTTSFHWRGIFKDENAGLSAPGRTYFTYAVAGVAFTVARLAASGADDIDLILGAYSETLAGALTPFVGGWILMDVNYDHPTDQLELLINGAQIAVPAGGSPGARAMPGAGGTAALWNAAAAGAFSDGIVGLFQGLSFGRKVTLSEHTADATELEV
jgi:hypothetical protein